MNKNRCEKSLIKRNKIFKCTSNFSNDSAYAFSHQNIRIRFPTQKKLWIKQHSKWYSTFYHAQYLSVSHLHDVNSMPEKKIL